MSQGYRFSRALLFLAGTAGLAIGTFTLGRSSASGVPSTAALTYAGVLRSADGSPLTDESITIKLWQAGASDEPLCVADDQTNVRWDAERFSVVLPDECTAAVHAQPDVEVEVLVGEAEVSLGRSKLGAVPYALEADRASNATGTLETRIAALEARQSAALEGRIAALEARQGSPSAFKAIKGPTQLITAETVQPVSFENVIFDLGDEFDQAQSVFTPQQSGLYHVACTLYFQASGRPPAPGENSAWFAVRVMRKQGATEAQLTMDGFYGDQVTAYRSASAMVRLDVGDSVDCRTDYQVSTQPASAYPQLVGGTDNGISTFEAYLISAESCDWEGTWETTATYQGAASPYDVVFTKDGDGYRATYVHGYVEFDGTGNDLSGRWTNIDSTGPPGCSGEAVEFHKTGCSFEGTWRVCNDPTIYTWNGRKRQ